jgi:hypothetical protein
MMNAGSIKKTGLTIYRVDVCILGLFVAQVITRLACNNVLIETCLTWVGKSKYPAKKEKAGKKEGVMPLRMPLSFTFSMQRRRVPTSI